MPKSGQAAVPTPAEFALLRARIAEQRHPEKNAAIMQVSFKLGLRVQEIALLQVKEVAFINKPDDTGLPFTLKKTLKLPANYTKGANAVRGSTRKYKRTALTFKVEQFNQVVQQITDLARRDPDAAVDPENFYPPAQKRSGKARDLPMVDPDLRQALGDYLLLRLAANSQLKASDPLFVSQKGGPYSPNSLQDHMRKMLTEWAGIEGASSHSGRRAVATDIIHGQGHSVKVAQTVLGHKDASTTLIYEQPPPEIVGEALKGVGESLSEK